MHLIPPIPLICLLAPRADNMPDSHQPTTASPFIALGRRFADISDQDLDNPDDVLPYFDQPGPPDLFRSIGLRTTIDWSELLTHPRVVLLAAAGGGKTCEMQHHASRLSSEGLFAFYAPLEAIATGGLPKSLEAVDRQRFHEWRRTSHRAWLFLDAADELKLTRNTLPTALCRLSDDIDPTALNRTHTIISSRPSDWHTAVDRAAVLRYLPLPTHPRDATPSASERAFLNALRHEFESNRPDDTPTTPDDTVRQFALLALSDAQIRQFTLQSGVDDPDRFFDTLHEQDAWSLARQPLDLIQLIQAWNRTTQIGTQTDLVESQVFASLTEDPDRPTVSAPSDTKTRDGAERLAIALPLTGTLAFNRPHPRHPEEQPKATLDPAAVLPDWSPPERDALLRLPIFEPAAYGRFRFRHRALQEYLAARYLATLRNRGMTSPALHRHLFARMYGVDVVIPSRRAIAAWLAIWDHNVRTELLRREPEVLLAYGDPEALTIPDRRNLIRALTLQYGAGGYRGVFDAPDRNQLRRFAHPDLADAINECWPNVDNAELQEVLLVIIELGVIRSCAGIAEDVACDPAATDNQRLFAIAALLACGKLNPLREILDAVATDPGAWPGGPPPQLTTLLFPDIISVDELMTWLQVAAEVDHAATHPDWVLQEIAQAVDPESPAASKLRDRLSDSVIAGSTSTAPFDLRSECEHLSPALATLCRRQLESNLGPLPQPLLRACAVAGLFAADSGPSGAIPRLRQHIEEDTDLRRDTFWAAIAVVDTLFPDELDPRRYGFPHDRLIFPGTQDRIWLLQALSTTDRPQRRPIALHALLDIWHSDGRATGDLEAIRSTVSDDPALLSILQNRTSPPPPDPEFDRRRTAHHTRQIDRHRAEQRRIDNWREMASGPTQRSRSRILRPAPSKHHRQHRRLANRRRPQLHAL